MSKLHMLTTTKRKTLYSFNEHAEEIVANSVGREAYYEYRELWIKTSRVEIELDFPLQLDIELNSSCNLRCPMCPGSIRDVEPMMKLMDFELYRKVVSEGLQHGLKAVNLNFVNEPLLRRDIGKFISFARERGAVDVMFNSNGLLLSKDFSRDLIASGLTKLSVSLDAFTKEAYERIRIGSNFECVKKNLLDFLEIRKSMNSRLPLLKLTYLMTAYNAHELDPFLDYWQDKADLVSLQNMHNPYDGKQRDALNGAMKYKNEASKIDRQFLCPHPFQRMAVRYNGVVLPCCSFRGTALIIGNVNESGIYDIYHSQFARDLRMKLKAGMYESIPVCKDCILNSTVGDFK